MRGGQEVWRHVARPRLRDARVQRRVPRRLSRPPRARRCWPASAPTGWKGLGVQLFDAVEGEHAAILGLPLLPLLGFPAPARGADGLSPPCDGCAKVEENGEERWRTKSIPDATAALAGLLRDGMLIMAGGFGLCGIPSALIEAIRESGVKDLTVVSNNAGIDDAGLGVLLQTRQIKKMISSYVGENATFMQQYLAGELEIEFNPQGTLAERIRAGGAGIPAFFTRTGVGTDDRRGQGGARVRRPPLHHGARPVRRPGHRARLEGRHRGQPRLPADRAQLQPADGDRGQGDGRRGRAPGAARRDRPRRTSSPPASSSSAWCTCPIRTSASSSARSASVPTPRPRPPPAPNPCRHRRTTMAWTRDEMAARAARELEDGMYVNLGIGIPTLVANHIPPGISVQLHSENGMLGIGPFPYRGRGGCRPDQRRQADGDAAADDQSSSTARRASRMIRGGHIAISILGALQVARERRPGELDGARQDGQGHGRRDGPGRRRAAAAWC